jgi:protein phosphatase
MSEKAAGDAGPSLGSIVEIELAPTTLAKTVRSGIDFAALSDAGSVRPNNEDQYIVCRLCKSLEVLDTSLPGRGNDTTAQRDGYLLLVADGMGGAAAGEYASALVVEGVRRYMLQTAKWFFSLDDPDENVRVRLLRESLERLDRELLDAGLRDPSLAGMGTTLTAAGIVHDEVFVVHVGDSRVYLYSAGRLERLTRDHTVAQQLLDAGLIGPEEAKSHRLRHVLTNVVGGSPGVKGEIVKLRLSDGDRLLLCTDGLNDMVTDDRIAEILHSEPRPAGACRALVQEALRNGGCDNVTVIVANHRQEA